MKSIQPDETYFEGAISFERGEDFIRPWRIPFEEVALYEPWDRVPDKASRASGVRLRFETDSPIIELEARCQLEALPTVDLVHEGKILATHAADGDSEVYRFQGLGDQSRVYELWLPTFGICDIKALGVADGAKMEVPEDKRPHWLTYGSSITHCRTANSPARAWPATASRKLGLNLTSLGFGGNCHLEPMIGRLIRDTPADIITMKLGINVWGGGTSNMRTFRYLVIGFVKLIREKQPRVPIGLITPIWGCERETNKNSAGMTLEEYREELRAAYEVLKQAGDDQLFLFEGSEMLGEEDAGLLPDNLHPNGRGYELMGERAAEKFLPVLLDARE